MDFGQVLDPTLKIRISDHENVSCCETPDFEISVSTKNYHYQKFVEIDGEWQYVSADFNFTYTELFDHNENFMGIEFETEQLDQLVQSVVNEINNKS